MSGWLARSAAILVVAVLAFGAGTSTAGAAEGDYSLVPRSRLTEKPFRGITLVTVDDRVVCTGFVVSPRKVVTAAHCLVRNAAEGDYRLKPGLPGTMRIHRSYSRVFGGASFRSCGISHAWAHSKFVKSKGTDQAFGSHAHDYAVLTTEPGCAFPRNAVLRLWATEHGDGRLKVGQKIRAAGYPADPRFDGMDGLNMWRTEGRIRPIQSDPRHLVFTGFVSSGMSGGPVWRTYRGASPCGRSHCVVGIITECAVNGKNLCQKGLSDRLAVRITPQVKQVIKRK